MKRLVCMKCAKVKGYKLETASWVAHGACQSCKEVSPLFRTIPECEECQEDEGVIQECSGWCGQILCERCHKKHQKDPCDQPDPSLFKCDYCPGYHRGNAPRACRDAHAAGM